MKCHPLKKTLFRSTRYRMGEPKNHGQQIQKVTCLTAAGISAVSTQRVELNHSGVAPTVTVRIGDNEANFGGTQSAQLVWSINGTNWVTFGAPTTTPGNQSGVPVAPYYALNINNSTGISQLSINLYVIN